MGGLLKLASKQQANSLQMIWKVWVPGALLTLARGIYLNCDHSVSCSAMSECYYGHGGLGDLATRCSHERFNTRIMIITIVVLIILI